MIFNKIKQKLCKHQYHSGRPITINEQCSNGELTTDFNIFLHLCDLCGHEYLSAEIIVSEIRGTFSVRNNVPIIELLLLPVPVHDRRPCALEEPSTYLVRCASCNKYSISKAVLSSSKSFIYLCDKCRHLCVGHADSVYKTRHKLSAEDLHDLTFG